MKCDEKKVAPEDGVNGSICEAGTKDAGTSDKDPPLVKRSEVLKPDILQEDEECNQPTKDDLRKRLENREEELTKLQVEL